MRTSTGLLAILVVALLAVASIPSPTTPSGWQEAQDASMLGLWQTTTERSGMEPSRWRQSNGDLGRGLPSPFGVLQAWVFWPIEMLGSSFW